MNKWFNKIFLTLLIISSCTGCCWSNQYLEPYELKIGEDPVSVVTSHAKKTVAASYPNGRSVIHSMGYDAPISLLKSTQYPVISHIEWGKIDVIPIS